MKENTVAGRKRCRTDQPDSHNDDSYEVVLPPCPKRQRLSVQDTPANGPTTATIRNKPVNKGSDFFNFDPTRPFKHKVPPRKKKEPAWKQGGKSFVRCGAEDLDEARSKNSHAMLYVTESDGSTRYYERSDMIPLSA